jgi:hypothetical protein
MQLVPLHRGLHARQAPRGGAARRAVRHRRLRRGQVRGHLSQAPRLHLYARPRWGAVHTERHPLLAYDSAMLPTLATEM